ncbi:MAG TPA: neutral/alkaline non-lysosomal ceramidase N-terminal domain-containing protein [Planctomycetaceae bacterium]
MTTVARSLRFVLLLAATALPLSAAEPLSVGVGRAEITPPLGYPMSGYFHARGATGTLDPLYAKAIVFKQGEVKAALIVCDLIGIDRQLTEAVRPAVEQAARVPAEHVVLAATHTHTGPNYKADLVRHLGHKAEGPAAEGDAARYVPYLIRQITEAARAADRDLREADLRAGSGHEDGVSFNRRFLLKDGTVRTWASLSDDDVVKAAGPIDPEVGLIAFVPAGGDRPFAAVVNFALHCDTVGGTQYSADFPGHVERVLRKDLGPDFASVFATGPCGDINHNDPTGRPRRSAAEIGERIAAAAAKALPELKPVAPALAVRRAVIDVPLQTYTAEDLAWAEDLIARDRAGEKFPTTVEAKAYKIRRLHLLRTGKADLGRDTDEIEPSPDGPRDSLPAEVQVVRLGRDTALVALPGEVFVELGLAVKQASPFEHTFVIELANDSPAYVPTRKAFEQGGYEANNSLYAPGGGEALVDTAVRLLNELKSE